MSGYRDDGDDEYGSGHGDVRRGYEQTKANSINTIASLGSLQQKDGKRYWLGMEVPDDLAPSLELFTSGLPSFIANKLNSGVYENAIKFHAKLSKEFNKGWNQNSAHKFALGSAAAVTAIMIGTQPGMTVLQAAKDRNAERSETLKNLKDIIDADKHYKDNEVVKTALEHGHKIMTSGLKDAASQLPTVIVNSYFAFKNHKALNKSALGALEKGGIENFDSSSLDSFNVDDNTQKFIGGGAVIGNALLKRSLSKDSYEELNKPNSYKMIMELKKNIDAGYGGRSDISAQVMEIFQQNEVDRGRIKFGDKFIPKLAPITERIAEVIASGELDPISLVNLVGKGNVIKKDGSGNRRFITTEQLELIIDDQINNFGAREKKTLEDLLSNHNNPNKVMQAIKDNLQNLKGDERAVFATLFSDDVLLKSGVKKKELASIRTHGHNIFCEFIKAKAVEIAQESPEELKAKNLSKKEIEAVKGFSDLVAAGDKKAIASAIRSTDEDGTNLVKSAVATIGLNSDKPNFWQNAIGEAKKRVASQNPPASMVEAVKSGRENGTSLGVV
ncbi:MAG: hypothetical protein ABL867_06440 [Rickettsiales bacterium]